ncbi:MAG TPA: YafY family protein [Stellaceae bacterium]|nr:YafY family protein [Stellaceae bacterium]
MRRTTRLFEIIQVLRSARKPMTAAAIAETLEVTKRTVYRDIASLQANSVPIHGEAGVGYVMRCGYDLPPLMLSVEEVEAVVVALSLVGRTGDRGLKAAAASVQNKIAAVLPYQRPIDQVSLFTSTWGVDEPACVDLGLIRRAIREERKLSLAYRDDRDRVTERIVRPIAIIYYVEVINIVAWCELREGFRHFRADRIHACTTLESRFEGEGSTLRTAWSAARPPIAGPKQPHDSAPIGHK